MSRILAKKLTGILILIVLIGCQQPTAVSETEPSVVETTVAEIVEGYGRTERGRNLHSRSGRYPHLHSNTNLNNHPKTSNL